MLRRPRAIEVVPSSKPLRWRGDDVPQHLAPETSDALRFCAVEGDLDLLDRRHGSTIEARRRRDRSDQVVAHSAACAHPGAGITAPRKMRAQTFGRFTTPLVLDTHSLSRPFPAHRSARPLRSFTG